MQAINIITILPNLTYDAKCSTVVSIYVVFGVKFVTLLRSSESILE